MLERLLEDDEASDAGGARRISTGCCSRRSAIRRRRRLALSRPERSGRVLRRRRNTNRLRRARLLALAPPADSPALAAMPTKPQTVFQVKIEIDAVDLRATAVRARIGGAGPMPATIRAARRFGRTARAAAVGADPLRVGARSAACARAARCWRPRRSLLRVPLEQQTWMLSVGRDRVIWQRTHALRAEEHEFAAAAMVAVRALGRTEYEPTWRAMQAFTACARRPTRRTRSG